MKNTFWCIPLLFLCMCTNADEDRSPINPSNPSQYIAADQNLKEWHLKDIEKDSLPGISWNRALKEWDFNKRERSIIAVLDTPLDIENTLISKYVWKNKNEEFDGLDNDKNGYIDDLNGWNFLGDTVGKTVLFNHFEYTRMYLDNKHASFDEDSLSITRHKDALEKYHSKLKFATNIVQRTPLALKRYREELQHPALPTDENDITLMLLDSLIEAKVIKKEEVAFLLNARKYNLTLSSLVKDSVNWTRHLDYYLNLSYRDRGALKNYRPVVDSLFHGNNFVASNSDILNHALKTAGTIALALDKANKKFPNIELMPIAISNYGDEHDLDILGGIRYAVNNGAKVINMSSGKSFSMYPNEVLKAIEYAASKDVLFITAAGNDNVNLDRIEVFDYPNDTDFKSSKEYVSNFLKVGASSHLLNANLKASLSNYGKDQVDVFAPGEQITTLNAEQVSGTSYAAPQVSLIAALLFSQFPSLTAPEVKQILMDSSVKYDILVDVPTKENPEQQLPFSELSKSGGIVNAYNAMLMAAQYVNDKGK